MPFVRMGKTDERFKWNMEIQSEVRHPERHAEKGYLRVWKNGVKKDDSIFCKAAGNDACGALFNYAADILHYARSTGRAVYQRPEYERGGRGRAECQVPFGQAAAGAVL